MTRASLSSTPPRQPTVALLLGLALAFCLAVLSIQSSFTAPRAASRVDLDSEEVRALSGFQSRVQQCVMCQATVMKISMKRGQLKLILASMILACISSSGFHAIPMMFQQYWPNEQVKKR